MNKPTFVILLFLTFGVLIVNGQTRKMYGLPKPLKIHENELEIDGRFQDSTASDFVDGYKVYYLEVTGLYPIGWSRNGKLAYIYRDCVCEKGLEYHLVIKDLIVDSIVNSTNLGLLANVESGNLEKLWAITADSISDILTNYSIVQNTWPSPKFWELIV